MATGRFKPPLQRYPRVVYVFDSSNVKSLAYNPEDMECLVTYQNSESYVYQRVSASEFGQVVGAQSVGKAVLRYLRPKQHRKV